MTDMVTPEGFYALRHHTLVTFAFDGIADDHLQWFSHQNALSELFLEDITDHQLELLRWSVHFDSSIGVEASFKCEAIGSSRQCRTNRIAERTQLRLRRPDNGRSSLRELVHGRVHVRTRDEQQHENAGRNRSNR